MSRPLIIGEYRRLLDDRFRLSIPTELAEPLAGSSEECILAKEQVGALSLWNSSDWGHKLDEGVRLVRDKMQAGRLDGRIEDVQMLGRLLSTRHTKVKLAGRSRLVIPEGFREFLGVDPGSELLVIGAALCIELWRPAAWFAYIQQKMPDFRRLFDNLSG
ncbi:MAG: division/cell wall cluster transcriptional repressor MraZ [Planctomycetota bacterium]|nr:division/cell wall cluster transcriptional repressor MraZ [Planctomycetota bacterium]